MTGHYFSVRELTRSETAERLGIDNTPPMEVMDNLNELIEALDLLREMWGSRIYVNSGYRCPELNAAVGGVDTSAHVIGSAADIVPADGRMGDFVDTVMRWKDELDFDQIILEKCSPEGVPQWVHVGLKNRRGERRGQVLKM